MTRKQATHLTAAQQSRVGIANSSVLSNVPAPHSQRRGVTLSPTVPTPAVSPAAASHLVDLHELRLDEARALVGPVTAQASAPPNATRFLQSLIDGLCELSLRDPLTGLANRRHFLNVVECEIDRVARSGESALLLLLDIDHFKYVNDTHGHLAGDRVLQEVARILATCVRPMDTLARYGGEEFAVVLPGCQAAFGHTVAERIRQTVEATPIRVASSKEVHVTISIGGAFALQWIRSTASLWVDRADLQLYKAKSAGRNRVHIEEQPSSTVTAEEKGLLFGTLYPPSGWDDPSPQNPTDSAF